MKRAYIAVGSNIDPAQNILKALRILKEFSPILALSPFYRNRPLNRPEQQDFYNGVLETHLNTEPGWFKSSILRTVESRTGRIRTKDPYASRVIDLDLILIDDTAYQSDDLVLPDPDIFSRPFLAIPLFNLRPDLEIAGSGESLAEIVKGMDTRGLVRLEAFSERLHKELIANES